MSERPELVCGQTPSVWLHGGTSHAVVADGLSDDRCSAVAVCGVKVEVPPWGPEFRLGNPRREWPSPLWPCDRCRKKLAKS